MTLQILQVEGVSIDDSPVFVRQLGDDELLTFARETDTATREWAAAQLVARSLCNRAGHLLCDTSGNMVDIIGGLPDEMLALIAGISATLNAPRLKDLRRRSLAQMKAEAQWN